MTIRYVVILDGKPLLKFDSQHLLPGYHLVVGHHRARAASTVLAILAALGRM